MALRKEELICMTKSTLWCVWGILSWVWSLLFPMHKPKKHLQTLALTLNLNPPLLITSNKSDQNNVISSNTPSPYSSLFNAPLSTSFDRTMDDLIGSENGVYNVPDIDPSEMTQNSRPKPNIRKRAMQYQCRPPPPPPMPLRSPSGDKLLVEGFTRVYENGRLILTQESDPLDVESSDEEYLFEAHRENNRLRLNLVSHPTKGFCYPISKQVRKRDISEDEEAEVVDEEANKSEEKMKMRERKGKDKEVCLVDYEEEVENDDEVEDRRVGIASCWEIGGTSGSSTSSSSNNGDDDVGDGSSLMMMRCAVDAAAAARSCGPRFDEPIPINPAVLAALFN